MLRRHASAILLVALQLSACTVRTTRRVLLEKLGPEELGWLYTRAPRIAGVTTHGITMIFDSLPAPREVNDTVFANVGGRPHAVARADIAEVWVARPGHRAVSVHTSDLVTALGRASFAKERIGGITTKSGDLVHFDRAAPVYVAQDTLFASVDGRPVQVALDLVQRVWVVRSDRALSLLASIGVTAGVLAILAGAAVVAIATGPGLA